MYAIFVIEILVALIEKKQLSRSSLLRRAMTVSEPIINFLLFPLVFWPKEAVGENNNVWGQADV
jgi:hypothetical protein